MVTRGMGVGWLLGGWCWMVTRGMGVGWLLGGWCGMVTREDGYGMGLRWPLEGCGWDGQ